MFLRANHDAGRNVPLPKCLRKNAFAPGRAGIIRPDRDISLHFRASSIFGRCADDIVRLLDCIRYICRVSVIQRLSLTDRQPNSLVITRPDDKTVIDAAAKIKDDDDARIPKRNACRGLRMDRSGRAMFPIQLMSTNGQFGCTIAVTSANRSVTDRALLGFQPLARPSRMSCANQNCVETECISLMSGKSTQTAICSK